jgi:hypothetical protein
MKTSLKVALTLATLASVVAAQEKTEASRVDEQIVSYLTSELSGWRHNPVEPLGPTTTVVTQQWCVTNRNVMLAIAIRKSVEDAKQEFRNYRQFRRDSEHLTGHGDEAYVPERNGSQIVLRKGRFVVYISIVTFVESDWDAQKLSKEEIETRRKTETDRILREFARLLSALDLQ